MRSFQPVGKNLLLHLYPEEEQLIIGSVAKTRKAVVESKSRMLHRQPPHEKDNVLIPSGCGTKVEVKGAEYLIVSIDDVIAEI